MSRWLWGAESIFLPVLRVQQGRSEAVGLCFSRTVCAIGYEFTVRYSASLLATRSSVAASVKRKTASGTRTEK
jgi:hypothetical protein